MTARPHIHAEFDSLQNGAAPIAAHKPDRPVSTGEISSISEGNSASGRSACEYVCEKPAPCLPDPAANGGAVCKCGASADPERDGFCRGGHPLPGQGARLSRTHQLHAEHVTPAAQQIEAGARAMFEQSLTDAGGPTELIAREVAQHENRAVVQMNIRKLSLALETHGLFDRRGRLRVAWISKLESLINASVSIDRMLGLTRRTRRVPTLADYVDERGNR